MKSLYKAKSGYYRECKVLSNNGNTAKIQFRFAKNTINVESQRIVKFNSKLKINHTFYHNNSHKLTSTDPQTPTKTRKNQQLTTQLQQTILEQQHEKEQGIQHLLRVIIIEIIHINRENRIRKEEKWH